MEESLIPEHTKAKLEQMALDRYQELLGKVVEVRWVQGYIDDHSDDFECNPPAKVKIVETTRTDILHWNGNYLDPMYDIELVEPHPVLKDVTSLWLDAESYHPKSGRLGSAIQRIVGNAPMTPNDMRQMDGHPS